MVRGLRSLRIGAIGARPAAFNTVRYSEKLLEASGISRRTHRSFRDPRPHRAHEGQTRPQAKLAAIQKYVSTDQVPAEALMKMAKLGAVIDGWMEQTAGCHQRRAVLDLDRRILRRGALHRHEHDERQPDLERLRSGYLRRGRHARAAAGVAKRPSALLDWNNNYGDDPDKAVCFHCSNLPKHFFQSVKMDFQEIIAGTVGRENTFGTCVGRVKAEPMSFARFSTDDREGKIGGYVGEGDSPTIRWTPSAAPAWWRFRNLQKLLHYICENGFEHHVAANLSTVARAVHEATATLSGLGRVRSPVS